MVWEASRRRSESLSSSHGHRLALSHSIHLAVLSYASRPTLFLPQLLNSPCFLLSMTEPVSGNDPALLTVPEDTRHGRPVSPGRNSFISARGRSPSPSTISLASSQQHPSLRARHPSSTAATVSVSGGPYSRPQTAYASIVPTSSCHSLGLNHHNSSCASISSTRSSAASSYTFHVEGSETATSDHLSATDLGGDIAEPTHDTAPLANRDEEIILGLRCITPTMTEDKKYEPPRL